MVVILLIRKFSDDVAGRGFDSFGLTFGIQGCLRYCARHAWDREGNDRLAPFHRDLRILAAGDCGFGCALRAAPQPDNPLVEGGPVRRGGAASGNQAGSHDILVPRKRAGYNLDRLVGLTVRKSARVLHPHSGNLIVDAGAVIGQLAWLSLDLDGAAALEFESCNGIDFLNPAEHARIPHPVKQYRLAIPRGCRL